MPKRILQEIALDKIACVDRPCQEGAVVAIMKRAEDELVAESPSIDLAKEIVDDMLQGKGAALQHVVQKADAEKMLPALKLALFTISQEQDNPCIKKAMSIVAMQQFIETLPPEVIALVQQERRLMKIRDTLADRLELLKRDFSEKAREQAADKGQAMPDGSFPIKNESDLRNAERAIGRAKDPAAVRAHIARRAKALGVKKHLERVQLIEKTWSDAARQAAAAARAAHHGVLSAVHDAAAEYHGMKPGSRGSGFNTHGAARNAHEAASNFHRNTMRGIIEGHHPSSIKHSAQMANHLSRQAGKMSAGLGLRSPGTLRFAGRGLVGLGAAGIGYGIGSLAQHFFSSPTKKRYVERKEVLKIKPGQMRHRPTDRMKQMHAILPPAFTGNHETQFLPVTNGRLVAKRDLYKLFGIDGTLLAYAKKLPANAKAGDYIHDFVNSSNSRFKGKDKKTRIRMALGAYYGNK